MTTGVNVELTKEIVPRPDGAARGQLAAAVAQVLAGLEPVTPDKRHAQQNFSYASEAAIANAVRGLMGGAGLALFQVDIRIDWSEYNSSSKGTAMQRAVAHVTYLLMHTSGESIEVRSVGVGSDSGDFAAQKALTAAHKSALIQLFVVGRSDDGAGPEESQARGRAQEKPQAPKKKESPLKASIEVPPNCPLAPAPWTERPTQIEALLSHQPGRAPGYKPTCAGGWRGLIEVQALGATPALEETDPTGSVECLPFMPFGVERFGAHVCILTAVQLHADIADCRAHLVDKSTGEVIPIRRLYLNALLVEQVRRQRGELFSGEVRLETHEIEGNP